MQYSHLYIPVFLSLQFMQGQQQDTATSHGQSRLASTMRRQNRSRHDPPEFLSRRIHGQALQALLKMHSIVTDAAVTMLCIVINIARRASNLNYNHSPALVTTAL